MSLYIARPVYEINLHRHCTVSTFWHWLLGMFVIWRMRWLVDTCKEMCSTCVHAAIACIALSSMRQQHMTRKNLHMVMDCVVLILQ